MININGETINNPILKTIAVLYLVPIFLACMVLIPVALILSLPVLILWCIDRVIGVKGD